MTRWLLRTALVLALGSGLANSVAWAQEAAPAKTGQPVQPTMPIVVHHIKGPVPVQLQPAAGNCASCPDQHKRSNPLLNCFNRHGYCCPGTPYDLGCGNGCTMFVHVFGSCRQFFNQPCNPNNGSNDWVGSRP